MVKERLGRRNFMKCSVALGVAAARPRLLMAAESKIHARPNIILIMVDDIGYGDAGCYGNKTISTQHIDALAKGGVRFTDFYTAGVWCVPSRMGLMTGVHPYRRGMGVDDLASKTTMAEMLKRQGYATAILGKGHLGMEEGLHPLDQGRCMRIGKFRTSSRSRKVAALGSQPKGWRFQSIPRYQSFQFRVVVSQIVPPGLTNMVSMTILESKSPSG